LSEQLSPESAPSPQEPVEIQSMGDFAEPTVAAAPSSRLKWIAPAWFFFGIIIGVLGFAAYNALIARLGPTTAAASAFDAVAVRSAARDGTLDAIATLQAGGPAAAAQQQPQGPQVVASNAFTVRDANRQGNPDAKVTIYEFSDFQ
jgi:hypothetical protein